MNSKKNESEVSTAMNLTSALKIVGSHTKITGKLNLDLSNSKIVTTAAGTAITLPQNGLSLRNNIFVNRLRLASLSKIH